MRRKEESINESRRKKKTKERKIERKTERSAVSTQRIEIGGRRNTQLPAHTHVASELKVTGRQKKDRRPEGQKERRKGKQKERQKERRKERQRE